MSAEYDLLIVGGGFAGLVCARTAAARGLKVAVIDRKPEPGARIHTTGIVVKEAAEEIALPGHLTRSIQGVRLYTPSLRWIDLDSPGYHFLATDTPGLLRWLTAQAEGAGAMVFSGTPFTSARREGEWIVLDRPAIRARYLVGADGARSAVAACFSLGSNSRFLVGVEAEFQGVQGVDPDRLHCFPGSQLAPGYIAWAVPGLDFTQIGLACRRGEKPSLSRLTRKLGALFDFSQARIVGHRSGLIPVGGAVHPVWAPGVLLVGDAAGLVSPLTGGGIHTAFEFGRRAGDAVAEYLEQGAPDPGPRMAAAYPRYRWKGWLRRLLDIDPPDWLYERVLGFGPVRALARLIYFHRKGLASPAAWRDIFSRR